jgi:hypothetical protein
VTIVHLKKYSKKYVFKIFARNTTFIPKKARILKINSKKECDCEGCGNFGVDILSTPKKH